MRLTRDIGHDISRTKSEEMDPVGQRDLLLSIILGVVALLCLAFVCCSKLRYVLLRCSKRFVKHFDYR